jgi:predicted dehydrogenase
MSGSFDPATLRQSWPMPARPRPIVIVGAGGIVRDAHLPAYRKAGFPVAGIYDIERARAETVARDWGLPRTFASLADAAAQRDAVFDVATPPTVHREVIAALPDGATVLIQKPMGRDLDDASAILALCRAKRLTAAVNFQLRFAPMMLAVRDAIERGLLGQLVDIEE